VSKATTMEAIIAVVAADFQAITQGDKPSQ
jgi:hypothetical protein